VERYGLVARGLGLLGGACADGGRPVPHWPWLSQGFLASCAVRLLRRSRAPYLRRGDAVAGARHQP